jgi:hypothetical protein
VHTMGPHQWHMKGGIQPRHPIRACILGVCGRGQPLAWSSSRSVRMIEGGAHKVLNRYIAIKPKPVRLNRVAFAP